MDREKLKNSKFIISLPDNTPLARDPIENGKTLDPIEASIEHGKAISSIKTSIKHMQKDISEIKSAQSELRGEIKSVRSELGGEIKEISKTINKAEGAFKTMAWLMGGGILLVLIQQPFIQDILSLLK